MPDPPHTNFITCGSTALHHSHRLKSLLLALCTASLSTLAVAGTSIDYRYQIEALGGDKPNQRVGRGTLAIDIDGARFQIRRPQGAATVSLDDGASTFLDTEPAKRSTPLEVEVAGLLDPMAANIEDESIKMSPTLPGPPLFGQATRVYEVEHRYTTVARIAFVVSRRFRQHAHYLLTVAEPGLSPAAMRVLLASGHGRPLALRTDAFTGLPLKIEGRLASVADDGTETASARFSYEATGLRPSAWPAGAEQK